MIDYYLNEFTYTETFQRSKSTDGRCQSVINLIINNFTFQTRTHTAHHRRDNNLFVCGVNNVCPKDAVIKNPIFIKW